MKKFIILISIMLLYIALGYAQVAINTDGSAPDSSAILDIKSTNRGLLLPRMTTVQISEILNPAAGLLVFNTDSSDFYGFNGSKWIALWDASDTISPWVCGDPITDSRDGKSYTTVQIGNQCWMAENLNIGTRIDGSNNQTDNGTIEKYCYDDDEANCDTYGGLYQWNEMMQYVTTEGTQGICPDGWHLPSDDEWKTLEMELGMSQSEANGSGWRGTNEGSKMAGNAALWQDGTLENDPEFGTSGLTVLPAGYRYDDGFYSQGEDSHLWSSSDTIFMYAPFMWMRNLCSGNTDVFRYDDPGTVGYSVRCVKN